MFRGPDGRETRRRRAGALHAFQHVRDVAVQRHVDCGRVLWGSAEALKVGQLESQLFTFSAVTPCRGGSRAGCMSAPFAPGRRSEGLGVARS
eukprot:2372353-Prorocentrum_lima.AAC.1